MNQWFLPTLSAVLALGGLDRAAGETTLRAEYVASSASEARKCRQNSDETDRARLKAEREWCGAIAALRFFLQQEIACSPEETLLRGDAASPLKGLILCGPVPILSHPAVRAAYSTWTFTALDALSPISLLPPAAWLPSNRPPLYDESAGLPPAQTVPLLSNDPLTNEQFCVALTDKFSLAMVLGENENGELAFQYSFDPEVVQLAVRSLLARTLLSNSGKRHSQLDDLVEEFAPVAPDYKTVMQFGQLLLKYMPDSVELETFRRKAPLQVLPAAGTVEEKTKAAHLLNVSVTSGRGAEKLSATVKSNLNREALDRRLEQLKDSNDKEASDRPRPQDVELLQAIFHEVRTPLATIRTLTRLLLKRKNLDSDVIKRLETIDRECTEQIDRFNLIFRAVEMQTSDAARSPVHLTSTPLAQLFNSCIPRWQKQASRRNLTLDVALPQKMPSVVSDPTMLDQVLTGVIDNFTSSLPGGSHLQVQVMLAGHQLKVQLQCQPGGNGKSQPTTDTWPTLKSLGQLLMFQPETGNISLNLSVTKNLFQALGGKLIVRQKPQQGEVLTIFLPLEMSSPDLYGHMHTI